MTTIDDAMPMPMDERRAKWVAVRAEIDTWLDNMNIAHQHINPWEIGVSIRIEGKAKETPSFSFAINEQGNVRVYVVGLIGHEALLFLDFLRGNLELELWGRP